MTSANLSAKALLSSLDEALDLLQDFRDEQTDLPLDPVDPLPSLLSQCEALLAETAPPAPLRSIHHFACTGGSLIAKCITTMPNVTLLSEIDPLSNVMLTGTATAPKFAPSDLIYAARTAFRPIDEATTIAVFDQALDTLHAAISQGGGHLVLRDHAHSQFCTAADYTQRPTLHDIVKRRHEILSVVTVRHPLESFLSVRVNGWRHFSPFTLEEYARRYKAFLERHRDLPRFRYEDFVDDPETELGAICAELQLPFVPESINLFSIVPMSGDSGRRSSRIAKRPLRSVPEEIRTEAANSAEYADLCRLLGYSPEPD